MVCDVIVPPPTRDPAFAAGTVRGGAAGASGRPAAAGRGAPCFGSGRSRAVAWAVARNTGGGRERARKARWGGLGDVAYTLILFVGVLAVAPAGIRAQDPPGWWQGGWRTTPLREGVPAMRDGFTFCRLMYTSVRREPGGQGWRTDYPLSDRNFMIRLPQLTEAAVNTWEDGDLGHAVVRATDPELFTCPFLFASDVGTAAFDDLEVRRLREFLLKGGFLWADDFWGERAWRHWLDQIRRVLPEYPVVELTPDHPIFSTLYHVPRLPQIPSIQFWRRSGGLTSERGAESAVPRMHGIFDERGRLLVLMTHNTDIADGWEREGESEEFFLLFSPEAYALAINVVIWAMSR